MLKSWGVVVVGGGGGLQHFSFSLRLVLGLGLKGLGLSVWGQGLTNVQITKIFQLL